MKAVTLSFHHRPARLRLDEYSELEGIPPLDPRGNTADLSTPELGAL